MSKAIHLEESRWGNCTSSEIFNVLSTGSRKMDQLELERYKIANPGSKKQTMECWPGDACLTYIQECNMERRLKRSISDKSNARPLSWGNCLEQFSFDQLGTEYILRSQVTTRHKRIKHWLGSADGLKEDAGRTVMDLKNPMTLKSFCQLVDPGAVHSLTGMDWMNALRNGYQDEDGVKYPKHKDGEKFYWQLVSNAVLEECKYAELIVHMPYESHLPEVRKYALESEGDEMLNYYWIINSPDDELPHLKDGCFYKNINIIRFEVPQADKDLLTQRVIQVGRRLINYK